MLRALGDSPALARRARAELRAIGFHRRLHGPERAPDAARSRLQALLDAPPEALDANAAADELCAYEGDDVDAKRLDGVEIGVRDGEIVIELFDVDEDMSLVNRWVRTERAKLLRVLMTANIAAVFEKLVASRLLDSPAPVVVLGAELVDELAILRRASTDLAIAVLDLRVLSLRCESPLRRVFLLVHIQRLQEALDGYLDHAWLAETGRRAPRSAAVRGLFRALFHDQRQRLPHAHLVEKALECSYDLAQIALVVSVQLAPGVAVVADHSDYPLRVSTSRPGLLAWRMLRWKAVVARGIAIYWQERTQRSLCAPGGAGRVADEAAFQNEF
jgi:hypothetical protein